MTLSSLISLPILDDHRPNSTDNPMIFIFPRSNCGFDLSHVTKLGRADGREVLRVRKQNGPRIADRIMKWIRPSL